MTPSGGASHVGLAVHAEGTGPAVLWLHGYTMDSTVWQPLWKRLPGWRHVGVDLPGHGSSAPLRPGCSLGELAVEIAAVARAEHACRVVALSFGTLAALQLAIDHRDAVSHLVLAAPTIAGAPNEPGTGKRYRELHRLYHTLGPGPHLTELWMRSPPDIFRGTERHPDVRMQLRQTINRHKWRELADGGMHSLVTHAQSASALSKIEASVLLLVGEEDMRAYHRNAKVLQRVVPRCRALQVDQAGHLALLELPDQVAPHLEEHFSA